ncbi:type I glutamate--ammonia ligase [Candidatus Bathyarchaeota archaeon]|nr:type I glutamate--ammonia ligase [Candidatus Bathyarchaeota archaeon]
MVRHKTRVNENFEFNIRLAKKADHIILNFTDLMGFLRGRTIPAEMIEEALNGVGFDCSSIPGGVSINESDMVMKPDLSTFTVFPRYFYDKSVVSFICNLHKPNGSRFDGDPRFICQKTVEKLKSLGYKPEAAAELEFYVVQKMKDKIIPVENHVTEKHRYFDMDPQRNITEQFRMELADTMVSMGITIERQQHEAGSAQNEITFKHSNPTETSDNIMRHKFAAKMVASKKYGWTATFMPKPFAEMAGNGMHIHLSLFTNDGKKNLFFDPEGYSYISQTARYFIGGLLEHAKALSAILAPTVNSYKRLIPGYEAPVYITWGRKNRSALLRVPEYFPGKSNEARIEYRCPDALCNPYLAYAVLFEAGLDGIKRKIEPCDPVEEDVYKMNEIKRRELGVKMLPKSLKEALEEWENDDICFKALGKEIAEKYLELKTAEWKEYEEHVKNPYTTDITDWELDKYLLM